MFWTGPAQHDHGQVEHDEDHEDEAGGKLSNDVHVERINRDGHEQTGQQNGPVGCFVSLVQFTQGGWEHTVFCHGVDEARRRQDASEGHGRHGDDGDQGRHEHHGGARYRVCEHRDWIFHGVRRRSGHEGTGVHHGGHDVRHDSVEHRGDDQRLNHASREVCFGVHDLSANRSDLDGAGKRHEHEGGCCAHAQAHRLEVLNGSTKIQIGGEQGHDAQDYDHGHGARDDGDLDFFDGLDTRQIHDEDEGKQHHGDGVRVDVVNAVVVGNDLHVGCKADQGER